MLSVPRPFSLAVVLGATVTEEGIFDGFFLVAPRTTACERVWPGGAAKAGRAATEAAIVHEATRKRTRRRDDERTVASGAPAVPA